MESLPAAPVLLLVNYHPEYSHGWGGKTYYRQLRIVASTSCAQSIRTRGSPTKLTKPRSGGSPPGATSGALGRLRRHAARAVMPARQEPRVDVEPFGGPPAVPSPHRFRPNPAELCEASRAPWTTRGSVRPAHSFRYTSRAVNGLAIRRCVSLVASTAAATRAASVSSA